jgi:hypothetical protein
VRIDAALPTQPDAITLMFSAQTLGQCVAAVQQNMFVQQASSAICKEDNFVATRMR